MVTDIERPLLFKISRSAPGKSLRCKYRFVIYHLEERSVSTAIRYKKCAQIFVVDVNKSPIRYIFRDATKSYTVCSSFRTSQKELTRYTNDPNVHIRIFCKRWSLILVCFFPVGILKVFRLNISEYLPNVCLVVCTPSSVKRFNSLAFTYSLRGLIKSIIRVILGHSNSKMSIILSHNQGIYISMNTYK